MKSQPKIPNYLQLWAKAGKETEQYHPLLFHMIDSGMVAIAMWDNVFTTSVRNILSTSVGLDEAAAKELFAFWIALHDLGKASPAFQRKVETAETRLAMLGFDFPVKNSFVAEPHGLVSAWAAVDYFEQSGLDPWPAQLLARALGGHHGTWPTETQYGSHNRITNLGGGAWKAARDELVDALRKVFQPTQMASFPEESSDQNFLLAILSGWISTADWMASMEKYFPYAQASQAVNDYAAWAAKRANETLRELGWGWWQPDGTMKKFEELFPFPARPIQSTAIQAAERAKLPALVILEAPTGTGKTETALYLADLWLQVGQGQGVYVAMPTTATSNQMFGRVCDFLRQRYPDDLVNLQLMHGQALLAEDVQAMLLSQVGEEPQGGVNSLTWFLPRKRTLLAPFGVGTVDQALLAVLQTRHFFVRLFGLQQKVVIFDEVHAYDTYMSELFWRLLEWLHAIGTSTIILSATLPEKTRQQLAQTYGAKARGDQTIGFPRITVVSEGKAQVHGLPAGESRRIRLERIGADPKAIAVYLKEKLANGGCAAVICNTVKRSQEVYKAIRAASIVAAEDLILFHARFPFSCRKATETLVLDQFGKTGKRPKRAVVVATQVIEQSLDLDFDLLVSDIAPVDLLIQRAGRLHRHERATRPVGLREATLALTEPGMKQSGDPDFGPDEYVYEPYILLKSLAVLKGRNELILPEMTMALVESAYGIQESAAESDFAEAIEAARKQMEKRKGESIRNARTRLVLPPHHEEFLTRQNLDLEEDAAEVHRDFQALTREAAPGIELVCLHRLEDGSICFDPEKPEEKADLENGPDLNKTRRFLAQALQVQRGDLVAYFACQPPPAAWKTTAALRNLHPVLFEQGEAHLPGSRITLLLDQELGLGIRKED